MRIVVKLEGKSCRVTWRARLKLVGNGKFDGVPDLWLDIHVALLWFANHDSGVVGSRHTFCVDRGEFGGRGVIPTRRNQLRYALAEMW